MLFQTTHALLKASKATPKFIPISSAGASFTHYMHVPVGYVCYGASKAAANYIARKIHFENEWLGTYGSFVSIRFRADPSFDSLLPIGARCR